MKKTYIYNVITILVSVIALASCNDYLDKLPDDRAEIDTKEKVTKLLVSAYPTSSINTLMELSSDNVADNGSSYSTIPMIDELYQWKDVESDGNDSPRSVWNGFYASVATANQALDAIANIPGGETFTAQIAEAKLVRAYSMFTLATCFCMAWNPDKADEYLGLPYPLVPEQNVNSKYERGTLRQLYEAINKDIEEALPYVDDNIYTVAKYHFNKKAAYAFAARFNLYYLNFEKAVKYANEVLGSNPKLVMRDYEPYLGLGRDDMGNRWPQTTEAANLLLLPAYSVAYRYLCVPAYPRFMHNYVVTAYETYWPEGPWGQGSSNNTLYYSHNLYGSNQGVAFPKLEEFFEYSDKINGIGYPHIVDPVFTGDETLLVRAEAYALLKQYENAIADMNTWIETHCYAEYEDVESGDMTYRPVLTVDYVNDFMDNIPYATVKLASNGDRSIRKELHPQGFTIEEGAGYDEVTELTYGSTQENIIQLILHMRRLETMFQGGRFYDIKRYGISFSHNYSGREAFVFETGDLRGAIQLPIDVIQAGLEPNPRNK